MDDNHLHILWTNADPVVFDKMVMMYAVNSLVRGWWERVTVILWGETARMAARDAGVKAVSYTHLDVYKRQIQDLVHPGHVGAGADHGGQVL